MLNPLCRRLALKELLPTAWQRLTKYPLLIEKLLLHTCMFDRYSLLNFTFRYAYTLSKCGKTCLQCFDAVGWLSGRKGIRFVKKLHWWGVGMDICLERIADLRMLQLMPLPLPPMVSCFSRMLIGFTFLVQVFTQVFLDKEPLNGCCCCCCCCVNVVRYSYIQFYIMRQNRRMNLRQILVTLQLRITHMQNAFGLLIMWSSKKNKVSSQLSLECFAFSDDKHFVHYNLCCCVIKLMWDTCWLFRSLQHGVAHVSVTEIA